MKLGLFERIVTVKRGQVLAACLILAAAIALLDRFVLQDASLGILYLIPLLVSAVFLRRWQVFICAIAAALLREQFGSNPWDGDALPRVSMAMIAFCGAALFVAELVRRRTLEIESARMLGEEAALRRQAEESARVLIESSPAAIVTVAPDGRFDLANDAARRLLGFGSEPVEHQKIADYFPMFADLIPSKNGLPALRTMIEGSGRRRGGESFFANLWLSGYKTISGTKLALVFADVSEEMRDRQEVGLRQLMMNSHIVVGAVSHEIRNLAAAAGVLHDNMAASCAIAGNEDFRALGRLVEAMRKLSSTEVPASAEQVLTGVNLNDLFHELRIIVASAANGSEVEFRWEITEGLPRVRADHSGLLQVFLNLTQNSRKALEGRPGSLVSVAAYQIGGSIVVRFSDNGPGISSNDSLFQPFQTGATSTGLGLYISRAIIRTYGGELQYVRSARKKYFLIELPALGPWETAAHG